MNQKIPVIAVQGPTASGKSATALAICEKFGGELISCDSMQIYRRMDIAGDQLTAEFFANGKRSCAFSACSGALYGDNGNFLIHTSLRGFYFYVTK